MRWGRALAAAAALAAFVQGAVALDVILRARAACREGEKWLAWSASPELARAHFDAELESRRAELESLRSSGRLDEDAFRKQLALARFERDRAAAQSPLERAAVWFESAADLFARPESRWSARARVLLAETRARLRDERLARGLPAEDFRLP
jgi:hypothetical protein